LKGEEETLFGGCRSICTTNQLLFILANWSTSTI